ncbi:MAG TPA: hypothetical protein VGO51_18165 [Burkholderiaceae bacterium]|jgi:hypothetical protein|nr:hypothetical protein [Burkholderiaceae bacterium]
MDAVVIKARNDSLSSLHPEAPHDDLNIHDTKTFHYSARIKGRRIEIAQQVTAISFGLP